MSSRRLTDTSISAKLETLVDRSSLLDTARIFSEIVSNNFFTGTFLPMEIQVPVSLVLVQRTSKERWKLTKFFRKRELQRRFSSMYPAKKCREIVAKNMAAVELEERRCCKRVSGRPEIGDVKDNLVRSWTRSQTRSRCSSQGDPVHVHHWFSQVYRQRRISTIRST